MRKKFALILFVALTIAGCGNETLTVETLNKAGFSDIEYTGWSPFSCGEDDQWSSSFRAINPKGKTVEGVVCCGLVLKQCTIRF